MEVRTVGRYRIERELGRGAMGEIFLAYDPGIDRRIALKVIQVFGALPAAERDAARERFLREARSAGKLVHPGIVTVFDVGESDGHPYIAMEYVEGTTLDAYCRPDAVLPVPVVIDVVVKAAEALAFAHARGIVHRDIKPANLMRVGESSVKIMDFGLAKSASTQLTHDGAVLGTPNYMAPEQIRGGVVDGRSDLWSLAVVLFELLTGDKPFGGESVSSVLYRVVHEPARDLSPYLGRVPVGLAAFLGKALAKDPASRYSDGAAFGEALRAAARDEGPAPRMPARGAEAAPPTPRRPTPHSAASTAPGPPPRSRVPAKPAPPARSGSRAFILATTVVVGILIAVGAFVGVRRGATGTAALPEPQVVEARVRTEPPGATIRLDGHPVTDGRLVFPPAPPHGTLEVSQDCRSLTRALEPSDAGREVVIVLDPIRAAVTAETGVGDAVIRLNGEEIGRGAATADLDLCRENVLESSAPSYRPAKIVLASGATPVEARTAMAGLRLQPLPTGVVRLPERSKTMTVYVDGRPIARGERELVLPEGAHEIRAVNEASWIDVTATFEIREGAVVEPRLDVPAMARLAVQAYPPNAKVYLRRAPGEAWRYVDDVPMERQIAAGDYDVQVEFVPTGETRERRVRLRPGRNPPVRVAFGAGR